MRKEQKKKEVEKYNFLDFEQAQKEVKKIKSYNIYILVSFFVVFALIGFLTSVYYIISLIF